MVQHSSLPSFADFGYDNEEVIHSGMKLWPKKRSTVTFALTALARCTAVVSLSVDSPNNCVFDIVDMQFT